MNWPIEQPPYEFRGVFWHGDAKDAERFYMCPACDGRLQWADDQWHCPRCGNEWADLTIRPPKADATEAKR
jgi:ribosomal protein L37AE/L43A